MSSGIFKTTGLILLATITKVYPETMTVDISFTNDITGNSLLPGGTKIANAQLPLSYISSGGGFIGGLVTPGTPVAVCQGESSSSYFIVAFLAQDPNSTTAISTRAKIPDLIEGEITIQAHPNTPVVLSQDTIVIGTGNSTQIFDTFEDRITNNFGSNTTYSQSTRTISGIIIRNKTSETDPKEIGLDPLANTTIATYGVVARNPPRVEHRELFFEYEKDAQVQNNVQELKGYNKENQIRIPGFINRRELNNDTLSLSLVYPYQLMETIKGTVVDIYGNILDINRAKLPLGEDKNSILGIKSTATGQNTNKNIYEQIKRTERKSIAYHFEINTRKEVEKSGPPNPAIRDNFARDRSRFFIDIDKEGLFKLNVPASSPTGNIPLLTRYENYSTVNPNPRSKDPNDISLPPDNVDILIESFLATGPIKIVDENNSATSPVDRFSSTKSPKYIGHGTVYHDITKTIEASTDARFYIPEEFTPTTPLGTGVITAISDVVSSTIINAGPNANAGGRSGSLNFDGSLELNIGANQVDSQSLWMDTEGGVVANIGEDKNGVSVAASMDGNVFCQLGSVETFEGKVFDLKVSNGAGAMTVFRIDNTGVSISTQGRYVVYSSGDMQFRSSGTITMDAESMVLMGRPLLLNPGAGPIR